VIAGSLAEYLEGGGYWWHRLQYLLGLRDLGHEVFWIDLLPSSGDAASDDRVVATLLGRMKEFDLAERVIVLLHDGSRPNHDVETFDVRNATEQRFDEVVRGADVLWNLCGAAKQPLLSRFARRVLIDLDPGVYQVSDLTWDMGLAHHEVLFTVGGKIHDQDSEVPTRDVEYTAGQLFPVGFDSTCFRYERTTPITSSDPSAKLTFSYNDPNLGDNGGAGFVTVRQWF